MRSPALLMRAAAPETLPLRVAAPLLVKAPLEGMASGPAAEKAPLVEMLPVMEDEASAEKVVEGPRARDCRWRC